MILIFTKVAPAFVPRSAVRGRHPVGGDAGSVELIPMVRGSRGHEVQSDCTIEVFI